MLTIDRYIVTLFFKVFLICFVSISGIYVVGDFVNNLSEFVDEGNQTGGILGVLVQYYGSRLPWIFDLSSRIIVVISVVFAVTWLQRHNEMAALMAAGISRARVIRPLIVAACLLSVVALLNREFGIPGVRKQLCHNAQDRVGDGGQEFTPIYDSQSGIWLDGLKTFAKQRQISQPKFELPDHLRQFAQTLIAASAEYVDGHGQARSSGYLLHGVQSPQNLMQLPSQKVGNNPVILSPSDTSWLKPDQCFVVSNISFEQLESGHRWQRYCSTTQLVAGLRNQPLQFGSDTQMLVHARIVQPLIDVVLLFLGLPIVLNRESRNFFVSAGLCILAVAAFFAVISVSHALGMHEIISPAFAAWVPLMIFVPCAVFWSDTLRS